WKALASIDIPVHIVRGQASSILEPALASRMLKVLGERGVLSVVSRAGHAVMLDNPVQSTALIAQFITNSIQSANSVAREGAGRPDAEKVLESGVKSQDTSLA